MGSQKEESGEKRTLGLGFYVWNRKSSKQMLLLAYILP
jgi:hypothetical protein